MEMVSSKYTNLIKWFLLPFSLYFLGIVVSLTAILGDLTVLAKISISIIWVVLMKIAIHLIQKIKSVWICDEGIKIYHQKVEQLVKWEDVARIYGYRTRPEFVYIKLKKEYQFGKSITFLPEQCTIFSEENPIIMKLKKRVPYYQQVYWRFWKSENSSSTPNQSK